MAQPEPKVIQAALRAKLLAEVSVTALVGSRVFPVVPKGDTYPCITYRRIRTDYRGSDGHTTQGADGKIAPIFELTIWSLDYDNAWAIFDAIRLKLNTFRGRVTVDGVNFDIRRCCIETPGEHDVEVESPFADQRIMYGVVVPLRVVCVEAIT